MLASIFVAISVPLLAGIAYLALRNRRPKLISDVRGIALQTVVIIVVLLAIAGAVAGVLVARGGEATQTLQDQVGVHLTDARFNSQSLCTNAGFVWDADGPDGVGGNADDGCYTF
ncbi:MAG: hypothetical protein OXH28_12570 [bacterium]|nr:hypothetical protein [bacterium]